VRRLFYGFPIALRASETFRSYPSSEAAAGVRQILGRPGEVWLPESGVDRLVVIQTPPTGH
jgi:virginiamycin B lyase